MVIIASKEGQFANRVLHFAHIASFCETNKISLVHLFFHEYLPYFPSLKKRSRLHILSAKGLLRILSNIFILFVKVLIKLRWTNLWFLEVVYYDRYDQGAPVFDISAPMFKSKAKRKIVVIYGWLFRDVQNFTKNKKLVQELFTIDEKFTTEAEKLIASYRKKSDVLVGVHIRRGDYKTFEMGRWFYEDEVYIAKMRALKKEVETQNLTVGFVICSNDNLDVKMFEELDVYHQANPFIIDFLLLKHVDYIIGPPSTFSALASFWNNVPLQFIDSTETIIQINSFKICQQV